MKYTIKKGDIGKRIDKFLSEQVEELSRSQIQRLIKTCKINGKHTKKNYKLEEGDEIEFTKPKKEKLKISPIKEDLNIIYQDEEILIINKPPNLPVHPDKKVSHKRTLINILVGNKIPLSSLGGQDRPGIVHRLDKDTSGLLIIAKTDEAYKNIRKQFENREVEKTYTALVIGTVTPKKGRIEAPIGRHMIHRKKMNIRTGKTAKSAISEYEVLETVKSDDLETSFSLVKVTIPTGRTHQIRVHFNAIGHPIIGDDLYGNPKLNKQVEQLGLTRQFLHASELSLKLPTTNKKETFQSDLPKELQVFYEKLR